MTEPDPDGVPAPAAYLRFLRGRSDEMVETLRVLVDVESPSEDVDACAACADRVDELARQLLGATAERIVVEGRTHLRWRFGASQRVLLLGHLDTVWPLGTLARRPFRVEGDRATGPGTFDMKAGLVQLFFALAAVKAMRGLDGVGVVVTSDEELGSPTSRPLIESTCAGVEAALVLEPSADGALKTQRKGRRVYRVVVTGRAAHAGLDPERGVNAAVELAHQVVRMSSLGRPDLGTTVTVGVVEGGTVVNTVPAQATAEVDVRAATVAELARVDEAFASLQPVDAATAIAVERLVDVPALERGASVALYERAAHVAGELGLAPLRETAAGGASDGNITAARGVPTLDGLGAVGGRAHAEGEFVGTSALPERAALVAALAADLLG